MQTDSSFSSFLMPRNWDVQMPGTCSISKPCDKHTGETLKQPWELLWSCQKARCFPLKTTDLAWERTSSLSLQQEGQVEGCSVPCVFPAPPPASPLTAALCHHQAWWPMRTCGSPAQEGRVGRIWSGAVQSESYIVTQGQCGIKSFPGCASSKESTANAGDTRNTGSVRGLGRSPGEGHGNPLQYSCLENPHGHRSLAGYCS